MPKVMSAGERREPEVRGSGARNQDGLRPSLDRSPARGPGLRSRLLSLSCVTR